MPNGRLRRTTNTVKQKPPNTNDKQDRQFDFEQAFCSLGIDQESTEESRTQSHLLNLPAELRSLIYATTLNSGPSINDFSLLCTNHQINMEATSILYQRPLTFPSQTALFNWIHQSSPSDLKRVRSLTLHIVDINISSLLAQNPSKRPSTWNLYQTELEALDHALQSLPGLSDLTIVPPERNNSQLLRGMYLSFLGMIPERLPRLRCLTVHDSEDVAGKVPSLRSLAKVVFDQPRRSASGSVSSSSEDEFRRIAGFMGGRREVKREAVDVEVKMEVDD